MLKQALFFFTALLLILASCGGSEDTSLEEIVITPAKPKCEVYSFIQFTATGNYADGKSEDLSELVVWADDSTSDTLFRTQMPGLANLNRVGTFVITAKLVQDSSNDITGYTLLKVFQTGAETANNKCEKI